MATFKLLRPFGNSTPDARHLPMDGSPQQDEQDPISAHEFTIFQKYIEPRDYDNGVL